MKIRAPLHYLQRAAVIGTVIVLAAIAWDHTTNRDPGEATYRAATDAFDTGEWQQAFVLFSEISGDSKLSLAARRGQANSLVQLARFEEAHSMMTSVIEAEPDNACNYATRGIIYDHLGKYRPAMIDYARAVSGCSAAVHGMSWFQRLLANQHERPPTVAERLSYLRTQMELPESERVLRVPSKDRVQKPWTT